MKGMTLVAPDARSTHTDSRFSIKGDDIYARRKKNSFLLLAITSLTASADETPRDPRVLVIKAQGEKARKQYCYSTFTIDENGNWTAKTLFSNGKNWDGDHFQAILTIKDKAGANCFALNQVAGVKGAFFCDGSCEREVIHSGVSAINSYDLTDQYSYQCTGWDGTDDLLIATGAVFFVSCEAAGGGYACSNSLAASLPETGEKAKETSNGCTP